MDIRNGWKLGNYNANVKGFVLIFNKGEIDSNRVVSLALIYDRLNLSENHLLLANRQPSDQEIILHETHLF